MRHALAGVRIQRVQKVQKVQIYIKHGLLSTVHILHRMCKSGEVRRLACP